MRRAALLDLAGMDTERFNILRRRDQLPFKAEAEAERGWQDFSLQDAFLLRMMLDLMDGSGVGPADARSILRLPPSIHDAANAPEDLWFGEVMRADRHFGPFFGTLTDLAERLAQRKTASRVIIVNASRAARFILSRAEAVGISE